MLNKTVNAKAGVLIFRNNIKDLETIKEEILKIDNNKKVKIVSSKTDNTKIIENNELEYDTIYLVTSVISEGINILNNNENWILILAPHLSYGVDTEMTYQLVK